MEKKKIKLWTLILLIFVPTFGFNNITQNAVYLGPAAIPSWFIVSLFYFLPLSIIIAELSSANQDKHGGIYSWINCGLGENWAFIGTWSYYIANLFYLQMIFARIPIMVSWAIFGENRFTDSQTNLLIILSLVLAVALTYIATQGVQRFSKISDVGGKLTLVATGAFIVFGIILPLIGQKPATVITTSNVIPKFDVSYFSTFSWLLLAVAGAEVAGTYIKDVDNPKKNFPKGVIISTLLIAVAYTIGSLAVTMVMSPDALKAAGLKDAGYAVFKVLADKWGLNGNIVVRFYAMIYTVASIAAYVIWIESPIRAMFSEVPKGTFPSNIMKQKEDGTLTYALWIQCAILLVLIFIPIFGSSTIDSFIQLLSNMTALSLVIPYVVLGAAYIAFKRKGGSAPFTMLKSKFSIYAVAGIMLVLSIFGFFGAGVDYFIDAESTKEAVKMILQTYLGPVILILFGYGLVWLNKKNYKSKIKDVSKNI